jgi:hypothetical protein
MARKVENEMKQAQGLEFWILSNFLDMDVLTFLYPSKHATLKSYGLRYVQRTCTFADLQILETLQDTMSVSLWTLV